MGCDIHLYREKRVGGQWVTADTWEAYDYGDGDEGQRIPYDRLAYTGRNYDLFGVLAKGVRRDFPFSFEPRGMPLCASPEVLGACESWDADGHSHSYLFLHEIEELQSFLTTNTVRVSGMKDAAELEALRASIASGSPDWSLLYPYCGWTNAPGHVEFEIDVPALFAVGDGLEKIIRSFDGIDGDNRRVVFWFDN